MVTSSSSTDLSESVWRLLQLKPTSRLWVCVWSVVKVRGHVGVTDTTAGVCSSGLVRRLGSHTGSISICLVSSAHKWPDWCITLPTRSGTDCGELGKEIQTSQILSAKLSMWSSLFTCEHTSDLICWRILPTWKYFVHLQMFGKIKKKNWGLVRLCVLK